ncbi:MAG: hypothetical protein JW804_07025 [Sedimentisphaerales bacterium]|nr:hypothetical protein [Sedimentisphaerales bacterium]
MTDKHILPLNHQYSINQTLLRFFIVAVFGVAFAYIESAVVVYLREIFHPEGFAFPLKVFSIDEVNNRLLLTETWREAATLVLILTSCWLFGRNRRQRFAYFLTIFAIWDIFYYVWLKILIDWPVSIMDYDILFLIPTVWASPALAPILASLTMLIFAMVILLLDAKGLRLNVTAFDRLGYIIAALIIVSGFCYTGRFHDKPDYNRHYSWLIFAMGELIAILIFCFRAAKADHIKTQASV